MLIIILGHIRQERPHHIGSSAPHPALMKKGSPFYPAGPPRVGPQVVVL